MSAIVAQRLVEHLELVGLRRDEEAIGGTSASAALTQIMIRAALSAGAMLFASGAASQFGLIRARGTLVIFLTHHRPNCAGSLHFAAGVWARAESVQVVSYPQALK